MRVSVLRSARSFDVAADQTVLDAALEAGIDVPHRCNGGNCGACRARLWEGEVHYPNGPPLGISQEQAADGLVLLCRAHARSDLRIETFEQRAAQDARVKRLPCRVERIERLAHDVMGVHLRLPAAEGFDFRAGQYVDVVLSKGRRRSFSIASPPHDSRPLELHVRRAPGGEFTEQVFDEQIRGALLTIEGPLGDFYYRQPEGEPAAPMLLIGGGTGLAPLNSIIRHVLEQGLHRDMTLYWGVRTRRDLYAHRVLQAAAHRDARLRYVPVLSEPSPTWSGRRGLVHETALADIEGLERYEIYASGPPGMVLAVRRDFTARGVPAARMLFDSFDYADDSPARQAMRADTNS